MNASRYLFTSFTKLEALTAVEIVVSTAATVILGSSLLISWFSLALSVGGLFLGVFLVAMFTFSIQMSSKKREVAILRALGAKQSSLLRAFLLRAAHITVVGCLVGVAIGYFIALLAAECSLLSTETVGFAVAASLFSSFGGAAVATSKLSDLRLGEVLRQ